MPAIWAIPATAELDLSRAQVAHLRNGLTVILLEDHSRPLVSVQATYKSGSRDESAGKTGLAHFLEHLAFRATAHFPNAGATEAIYDAGGEWHGYTWLDSTNYFATMPAGGLGLLLRIEADRMANVVIDPAAIDAEKGAVITEMHGYENDPPSVLFDAVAASALQAHPYRIPTIGYESDVRALTAGDARRFYDVHYAPANAVLAIVGDFARAAALAEVERLFGALPARAGPVRVTQVEPGQSGPRRLELKRPVDRRYFELAFPAPAASSRAFAPFLVLQQLLAGGSGVNFRQNEWGTETVPGSLLHGVAKDVKSFFIPTNDRYLLAISGSIPANAAQASLERDLERRIARFRASPPTAPALATAKRSVAAALIEDVQSTEDAAHQLAYFEAIGAFDTLIGLDTSIAKVSAADVARVAGAYLVPSQATIGWLAPGNAPRAASLGVGAPAAASDRPGSAAAVNPAPPPVMRRLSGGLPAIVAINPLSPTLSLALVTDAGDSALMPGLGIIRETGPAGDLDSIAARIAAALAHARTAPPPPPSDDPGTRLEQMIAAQMPVTARPPTRPIVAVVSGAIDRDLAFAALERALGRLSATRAPAVAIDQMLRSGPPRLVRERIAQPRAQAALGYVAEAPPPATREALAWRMLLYVLTHDYSGRLGRSAISDKGLVYHIYSCVRTNGTRGWATFKSGVDPEKLDAFEREVRAQLARLAANPPSPAEIDAARRHLIGRDLSSAQTNEEVADKLALEFVESGALRNHRTFADLVATITPAEVAAAARYFAGGTILRVDVGPPPR